MVEPVAVRRQAVMSLACACVCVGCGRVGFDAADAGPALDAAPAPWRLVQVAEAAESGELVLQPTAAGDLLIVAVNVDLGNTVDAITDDTGSTFTRVAAASCDGGSGPMEIWYAAGVAGGATTVTVNATPTALAFVVWVVANMRAADVLDAATSASFQPATSRPLGPPITTTAPGAFIVSVVKARVVSGIRPGNAFTTASLVYDDGYAHLADPMALPGTYQAEWDATDDAYCSSAAAFRARS